MLTVSPLTFGHCPAIKKKKKKRPVASSIPKQIPEPINFG
jgi:hypothetical protein